MTDQYWVGDRRMRMDRRWGEGWGSQVNTASTVITEIDALGGIHLQSLARAP
jgi:hypothetical protein